MARSTASSYIVRGTMNRVGMAQPWPAWVHTAPAIGMAPGRSASSSTRLIDLPPSSRNTGFRLAEAAAMMRWPVAVEPVKATMSTSGEVESTSPTR